jgi:superfamily II DNA/RNA helicase
VIKVVKREEKFNLIKEHLTKCDPKQRVILFSNTKHNVKFFNDKLWNDGLNCAAIHGDID